MRFTPRLAKLSIALTAAVFLLIAALWIRSAGHREVIGFQAEDSSCNLGQADGVIGFTAVRSEFSRKPGFHYTDDGDQPLIPSKSLGWGSFSFYSNFSGSHIFVIFTIPHWFLLCLSTLFLLPAVIHWRMSKTHAAQQAALSGRHSP